ncbi:MAG TPA: hypothetical protein VGW78_03815 [Candidatus Babeliales bacterium]|jgi:hypothetical protein|nr:hypothetical protein [Candidatus Babeliales bacterium]
MNHGFGTYTSWFPLEGTKGDFEIVDYTQNFAGLTINLQKYNNESEGKDTRMKVYFPGYDAISRVLNESCRYKFNGYQKEIFANLLPYGSLFKVEGSDYMKMLLDESYGIIGTLGFKHYAIYDGEWSFDVVSPMQPGIEIYIDGELIEKIEPIHHMYLENK